MAGKTILRKRGELSRLVIELDASQARTLSQVAASLNMTKTDAVSSALNIWFSMLKAKTNIGG